MSLNGLRSCRLSELLSGVVNIAPVQDREINGISLDSRKVDQGMLFIAVEGIDADGREYIGDALNRGCIAVVYENSGADKYALDLLNPEAVLLGIDDLKSKIGLLAARFFGNPSSNLNAIGVTGTNGKSTTCHIIASALDHLERKCGVIGTLGCGLFGQLDTSSHTTPDAIEMQRLFHLFNSKQATEVVLEASSHGIDQGRLDGTTLTAAVFTNLTRDHLDYHGDFASYGEVKNRLFKRPGLKYAIVNLDDGFADSIIRSIDHDVHVIGYSGSDDCSSARHARKFENITGRLLQATSTGLSVEVSIGSEKQTIDTHLIGEVNLHNLLAAVGVLIALGVSLGQAAAALAGVNAPPGRLELYPSHNNYPDVVVDYAHTPDALENVCRSLQHMSKGHLVCVFGCGGDRDAGKRAEMGAVAEKYCEAIILTDDNPRNEDGDIIIADILSGISNKNIVSVIRDRSTAIYSAVNNSSSNSIVLIAGKGHEEFQYVAGEKIPFSDRDHVSQAMAGAA